MKHTAAALSILSILAAGPRLAAQTDAEARLAGATSLKCTFPVSVRTAWKDGIPQPVVRRIGVFTVEIRDINAGSGSAVAVTRSGNHDITMIADEKNRYFLDAGGNRVAVTVVLGTFSAGTKLRASHSIHDFVSLDLPSFKSEPDVVQYSGDCDVTPAVQ